MDVESSMVLKYACISVLVEPPSVSSMYRTVADDTVELFRGFLDSNNALIADPILLYSGNIDTFQIVELEL